MTSFKYFLSMILLTVMMRGSNCRTRYFVKMRTNASELFKTKGESLRVLQDPIAVTQSPIYDDTKTDTRDEDERMIRDALKSQYDRKNAFVETSTFNPDVLNKFLEEYANKIKSTTEKDFKYQPLKVERPPTSEPLVLEIDDETTHGPTTIQDSEMFSGTTENSTLQEELGGDVLNDTLKRNKYYGPNSHDDRNGWVTLDAIPWSKSKISKWQANPSTQRPWPDIKPWEKPSMAKPWNSDFPGRPNYENNKPWYEKPKPQWPEVPNERPWSKPTPSSRPSHYPDKYEDSASQAEKWPPERPSWDKYQNRPGDIITDDKPTNFPNSWNRPQTSKPSYQYVDRYSDRNPDESPDWHDFPSKFDQMNDRPRPTSGRPHFSQYQYVNNHPPTHPSNGDGEWVLLSTNRGYSKSRQRSMKFDTAAAEGLAKLLAQNGTRTKKRQDDPSVAVMTSKRQVRLTVLPSVNGTNTTTSHGGLLEVEKTFKTVDQSRKEYEMDRTSAHVTTLKKRPIRNTLTGQQSSSAVLAAVGAGMLPATMAMMIPMMLGRRRRDLNGVEHTLRKSNDLGADPHELLMRYRKNTRSLRS